MQQKSSGCNWTRSELPTLGLRLQKQVCQINANQEAVFFVSNSSLLLCLPLNQAERDATNNFLESANVDDLGAYNQTEGDMPP